MAPAARQQLRGTIRTIRNQLGQLHLARLASAYMDPECRITFDRGQCVPIDAMMGGDAGES